MGKNAAEGNRKKGKIAEEIRKRIGRSVLIAYIVVEVIIVIIMGQTIITIKSAAYPGVGVSGESPGGIF